MRTILLENNIIIKYRTVTATELLLDYLNCGLHYFLLFLYWFRRMSLEFILPRD